MTEKWSPLWCESLLTRRMESWQLPPDRRRGSGWSSLWPWAVGPALIAIWFLLPPWREPALLNIGGNLNVVAFATGLALVIGKIREQDWPEDFRSFVFMATGALAFAGLIASFHGTPLARATRVMIEFLIPLAFFVFPVSRKWLPLKMVGGFFLLVAVPLASGYITYRYFGYGGFRPVEVRFLIPVMLPLIAWLTARRDLGGREWAAAAAVWLSPAQWIAKTPLLPDFLKSAPGNRSRALGMFWVAVGAAHIAVMLFVFNDFTGIESRVPENLLDFLWLGLVSYVRFYFHVYGASALTRGLFYLSGWETPAFFNFAPLAVSPQDRWRRWDIPVYMTYRLFVFIPVLRRTGSLALGIFLTFMTVASSYLFQALFYVSSPGGEQSAFTIGKIFAFYFLQACFVYIGLKLSKFWPRAERVTGWFGVLISTVLMALCYGIRHLPFGWFEAL